MLLCNDTVFVCRRVASLSSSVPDLQICVSVPLRSITATCAGGMLTLATAGAPVAKLPLIFSFPSRRVRSLQMPAWVCNGVWSVIRHNRLVCFFQSMLLFPCVCDFIFRVVWCVSFAPQLCDLWDRYIKACVPRLSPSPSPPLLFVSPSSLSSVGRVSRIISNKSVLSPAGA